MEKGEKKADYLSLVSLWSSQRGTLVVLGVRAGEFLTDEEYREAIKECEPSPVVEALRTVDILVSSVDEMMACLNINTISFLRGQLESFILVVRVLVVEAYRYPRVFSLVLFPLDGVSAVSAVIHCALPGGSRARRLIDGSSSMAALQTAPTPDLRECFPSAESVSTSTDNSVPGFSFQSVGMFQGGTTGKFRFRTLCTPVYT